MEGRKLAAILLFPFLALYASSFIEPGFRVTDYLLKLNLSDSALVTERLTYELKGSFSELYRSYRKDGPLAGMELVGYECPEGTRFVENDLPLEREYVCRGRYAPGTYSVQFTYRIPSPYRGGFFLWNVFDRFGSDIEGIDVRANLPVWVNPASERLPKGQLMQVMAGYPPERVVEEFTRIASYRGFIFSHEEELALGLLAIQAALLLAIYLRYGRESEVAAPEVLHYRPSDRRPYEVGYLFTGKPGSFPEETLRATLLDLARRGKLEIGEKLRVLDRSGLDEFEKRIVEAYVREGEFDPGKFREELKRMPEWKRRQVYRQFSSLVLPTEGLERERRSIFDQRGSWLALLTLGLGTLASLKLGTKYAIINGLWLVAAYLLDDYVFGRYSRGARKERAEWEAFRRLLSDYSMMEKYAPEDTRMWGDWLVFATLFGVADNVEKAMRKFRVNVPNIDIEGANRFWVRYGSALSVARPRSSGGISGGFGGGGGGAR